MKGSACLVVPPSHADRLRIGEEVLADHVAQGEAASWEGVNESLGISAESVDAIIEVLGCANRAAARRTTLISGDLRVAVSKRTGDGSTEVDSAVLGSTGIIVEEPIDSTDRLSGSVIRVAECV